MHFSRTSVCAAYIHGPSFRGMKFHPELSRSKRQLPVNPITPICSSRNASSILVLISWLRVGLYGSTGSPGSGPEIYDHVTTGKKFGQRKFLPIWASLVQMLHTPFTHLAGMFSDLMSSLSLLTMTCRLSSNFRVCNKMNEFYTYGE
jgi:hypothetical protein